VVPVAVPGVSGAPVGVRVVLVAVPVVPLVVPAVRAAWALAQYGRASMDPGAPVGVRVVPAHVPVVAVPAVPVQVGTGVNSRDARVGGAG
jgi:hypothetical protein